MKEIIFKDSLQKYLAEKMKKANDLFCCEEYRAGYIEACREIFLYADFCQSTSRKNFKSAIIMLFVELIRKQRGSRPCGKSSEMRARALIAVLFL